MCGATSDLIIYEGRAYSGMIRDMVPRHSTVPDYENMNCFGSSHILIFQAGLGEPIVAPWLLIRTPTKENGPVIDEMQPEPIPKSIDGVVLSGVFRHIDSFGCGYRLDTTYQYLFQDVILFLYDNIECTEHELVIRNSKVVELRSLGPVAYERDPPEKLKKRYNIIARMMREPNWRNRIWRTFTGSDALRLRMNYRGLWEGEYEFLSEDEFWQVIERHASSSGRLSLASAVIDVSDTPVRGLHQFPHPFVRRTKDIVQFIH